MDALPAPVRRRRILAGLVTAAATLAASGALLGLAPVAHATAVDNGTVLAHLNALRASHGLPALAEYSDLDSIAAGHSAVMARAETIFHNPSLTTQVPNWQVVGENVGMGPSAAAIDTAFDNSPEHLANEISSAYTQVGIGTASDSRGYLYITVDFRKPLYATAPAPAPAPAKRPVAPPAPPRPITVTAPTTHLRTTPDAGLAARTRAAALHAAAARHARAVQRARVAAVRAAAAHQAAGASSDPVGRALSFSRTLTALAG